MRRWIIPAMLLAGLLASACASSPQDLAQSAFQDYWRCAYGAARPHLADAQVAPREVAMRAQAACNPAYGRYQRSETGYVRSAVDDSADYPMADTLGASQALQRRRDVTTRLTELAAGARR